MIEPGRLADVDHEPALRSRLQTGCISLEASFLDHRATIIVLIDPGWRPRSTDESQAILDAAGLTGEFWKLGEDVHPTTGQAEA